ncbi:MAG: hypothetical protein PGN11_21855 [Quadrisphaera sp.]
MHGRRRRRRGDHVAGALEDGRVQAVRTEPAGLDGLLAAGHLQHVPEPLAPGGQHVGDGTGGAVQLRGARLTGHHLHPGGQLGVGGDVPACVVRDVDHAVVAGDQQHRARRQSGHEVGDGGVDALQLVGPLGRRPAVGVAGLVEVAPVDVDQRAGAVAGRGPQGAQPRLHAGRQGAGSAEPPPAGGGLGEAGAVEEAGSDPGHRSAHGGEVLEDGGVRLPAAGVGRRGAGRTGSRGSGTGSGLPGELVEQHPGGGVAHLVAEHAVLARVEAGADRGGGGGGGRGVARGDHRGAGRASGRRHGAHPGRVPAPGGQQPRAQAVDEEHADLLGAVVGLAQR